MDQYFVHKYFKTKNIFLQPIILSFNIFIAFWISYTYQDPPLLRVRGLPGTNHEDDHTSPAEYGNLGIRMPAGFAIK